MKTPEKDQVTPECLMQFGFAYAPPLIIGAAVSIIPMSYQQRSRWVTL